MVQPAVNLRRVASWCGRQRALLLRAAKTASTKSKSRRRQDCPFLVETHKSNARFSARSIEEAGPLSHAGFRARFPYSKWHAVLGVLGRHCSRALSSNFRGRAVQPLRRQVHRAHKQVIPPTGPNAGQPLFHRGLKTTRGDNARNTHPPVFHLAPHRTQVASHYSGITSSCPGLILSGSLSLSLLASKIFMY
jgi:hypothetical protein